MRGRARPAGRWGGVKKCFKLPIHGVHSRSWAGDQLSALHVRLRSAARNPYRTFSGGCSWESISPPMLEGARARGHAPLFWPVADDGQAMPFRDSSFESVICQLGWQFFPHPALGLVEFRRVLRRGGSVAVCVISTPDRAPMWGMLADVL